MHLFFSSNPKSLSVVDAVSLIAQHFVDGDEQPVLPEGDLWVQSDANNRPAPNLALVIKERLWAARVRAAALDGKLHLYGDDGDSIQFTDDTFVLSHVKVAALVQWLVDTYRMNVFLDAVRVAPTPPEEREVLKKDVLIARYACIWESIGPDLQEGSRNGLKKAAGVKRGYYDVQRALKWARENDKLVKPELQTLPPTPLNDLAGWQTPSPPRRSSKDDDWATDPNLDAYWDFR